MNANACDDNNKSSNNNSLTYNLTAVVLFNMRHKWDQQQKKSIEFLKKKCPVS